MCCSPWDCKESDTTWRLNNSNNDTGVLGLIVTEFWFELLTYLGHSASPATIFHTDQLSVVVEVQPRQDQEYPRDEWCGRGRQTDRQTDTHTHTEGCVEEVAFFFNF